MPLDVNDLKQPLRKFTQYPALDDLRLIKQDMLFEVKTDASVIFDGVVEYCRVQSIWLVTVSTVTYALLWPLWYDRKWSPSSVTKKTNSLRKTTVIKRKTLAWEHTELKQCPVPVSDLIQHVLIVHSCDKRKCGVYDFCDFCTYEFPSKCICDRRDTGHLHTKDYHDPTNKYYEVLDRKAGYTTSFQRRRKKLL